jgi:hypothetical protein
MSNHDREDPRTVDGDAALDRAWQQASDEVPPAQLDAAIIASARKAIQGRDDSAKVVRTSRWSRNWPTGWQPLAAAAGVAGLAFILVQSLPRDRDVAPSIQIEEPVSGPSADAENLRSPPAPQAKDEKAAAAAPPASAEAPVAARDNELKRPTVPPPPSPATVSRPNSAAGVLESDSAAGATAGMRAAEASLLKEAAPQLSSEVASEAVADSARQRGSVAPLSAEDWAARVEALYASGDVAGAADTLRAFRVADPDAESYLPESLREWARTVE